jgi:hypothetical protein
MTVGGHRRSWAISEIGPFLSQERSNRGRSFTSQMCQKRPRQVSLDHFISKCEQFIWDVETEHFSSLEVD